jgi:WD40 repeat protein/tetratricopeptide (TPR) repeat protein
MPTGWTQIWNARSGQLLFDLPGLDLEVHALAFSPDGGRLVTIATGLASPTGALYTILGTAQFGEAKVWDATTGTLLFALPRFSQRLTGAEFSPDGNRLVTVAYPGGKDNLPRVRLWNAHTGQWLSDPKDQPTAIMMHCVAFSADGKRVVAGGGPTNLDGEICIWDAQSGERVVHSNRGFPGVIALAVSRDGKHLATVGGQSVRLWDFATGKQVLSLPGHTDNVAAVAFSRDGTRLATGGADRTIRVWNVVTGQPLVDLAGHAGAITGIDFSPDGSSLVSVGADGKVLLWDGRPRLDQVQLEGSVGSPSVAYSPDKSRVAAGGLETVQVWDRQTGRRLLELGGFPGYAFATTYSPDGSRIASAGINTLLVWNAQTGEQIHRSEEKGRTIWDVAYSPDGSCFVTAETVFKNNKSQGYVRVRDPRTLEVLRSFEWPGVIRIRLGFVPGKPIVVGDDTRGNQKLWNHATGEASGGDQDAAHLALPAERMSPDRRTLALWAVATWDLRLVDLSPPDGAETSHRLLSTRPDVSWHQREVERFLKRAETGAAPPAFTDEPRAEAEKLDRSVDTFAALFHIGRLLSLQPHRSTELRAVQRRLLTDAPAQNRQDRNCFVAMARLQILDRIAPDRATLEAALDNTLQRHGPIDFRILGGLLLRAGKAAESIQPLKTALALRTSDRAPPVEEWLLATAYLDLNQPEEALRFHCEAVERLRRYQRIRMANIIWGIALNPAAGLADIFNPAVDPRRNSFESETWHESDVFRADFEWQLHGALPIWAAAAVAQGPLNSWAGMVTRLTPVEDPRRAPLHEVRRLILLGAALNARGQRDEAVDCFRMAIAIDPEEALAQFHRNARLVGDSAQIIALAEKCQLVKKQYHTATVLSAVVFADPKIAGGPAAVYRYFNAACSAALAAAGEGTDAARLDERERSRLRKQAFEWLRTDLVLLTRRLESGRPEDRIQVQEFLRHWLQDPDIAGIRDATALAKLPVGEQEALAGLRADVEALLKKAEDKPK